MFNDAGDTEPRKQQSHDHRQEPDRKAQRTENGVVFEQSDRRRGVRFRAEESDFAGDQEHPGETLESTTLPRLAGVRRPLLAGEHQPSSGLFRGPE